jgi:hypothetical protein
VREQQKLSERDRRIDELLGKGVHKRTREEQLQLVEERLAVPSVLGSERAHLVELREYLEVPF